VVDGAQSWPPGEDAPARWRTGPRGLAASGLCSLIGAKWFGLSFFGKTTVSHGADAVDGAIFMIVFGSMVFALHYLVFALVPAMWRLIRSKP